MILNGDPFRIFRQSKTPAGLYARQRWLNEETTPTWQADFASTVESLRQGQSSDGSWDGSLPATVHRLFGLHLTVREPTDYIEHALDWLIAKTSEVVGKRGARHESLSSAGLQGLPFTHGRVDRFAPGATLFLSSIFRRGKDPWIVSTYERLREEGMRRQGRWGEWSSSNNILRAFVVHPEYSRSEATVLAVRALKHVQRPSGEWAAGVPLYQTVNALAHLDLPEADAQLNAAFERLRRTQRPDGTWGRYQREWSTFLVVHALRNKGLLQDSKSETATNPRRERGRECRKEAYDTTPRR